MSAGRTVNSKSKSWGTPPKYAEAVRAVFNGTICLDPCSNAFSIIKAKHEYCLPEYDGLACSWDFPTIYVNPPYGSDRERGTTICDWVRRCAMAHSAHNSQVIALIPVATNTKHWKRYVFGAAHAVAFLADTRLRFLVDGVDKGKGAPMACAAVYWGNATDRFHEVFARFGTVVGIQRG